MSAATLTQDSEMVAALIQMGADVNSVDQNGRTPLMIASFIGNVEILEMLLAAGANPEFTNEAGESALTIAQTKEVVRPLRRAIVLKKFSSARKKETADAFADQKMKIEEQPPEEIPADIPADIEEALKHLEPIVEPPSISLDATQPMPILFQEMAEEVVFQPIIPTLDTTQPIAILFQELEDASEEDEVFIELEADLEDHREKDPFAAQINQFIQTELQASDVQPAILFESRNEYPLLTSDPMEELLMELPEVENLKVTDEIDEVMQTELHATENLYQAAPADVLLESLDPTEQLLEEAQEFKIPMVAEEIDDFSQTELHATENLYQASVSDALIESLDPTEQLLEEAQAFKIPKAAAEIEDFNQTELHATENLYQASVLDALIESLDPTEQLLEEAQELGNRNEIPQEVTIPEPVIEVPAPVFSENPPIHGELQKWEEWKDIEHAVAFAPWKIEDQSLSFEPEERIELSQEDMIVSKPPTVPPEILLNSTRTRNIAIGVGVAIFLIPFLLFMNWQLNSKGPATQAETIRTPINQPKPAVSAAKTYAVKSEPKVEIQKKSAVVPKKSEPKVVAAIKPVPSESPKKLAKPIKFESKKSQPSPVTLKASAKSPANDEKITKARELNNQGSNLVREGRVSEGISLLEQAVHTFPKGTNDANYASALLNLGRAWRMAGRPDITIRILEKRMKINIERDAVARELLAAKRQAVESGMGIRNN